MGQWWIDEPIVLGSSNPTTGQLRKLFQQGFRAIVSLLDENEQPPNYDVREIKALCFDRVSIPLKDFSAPTLDMYQTFQETMTRASGKPAVFMGPLETTN